MKLLMTRKALEYELERTKVVDPADFITFRKGDFEGEFVATITHPNWTQSMRVQLIDFKK